MSAHPTLPTGRICNLELSRIILGGNLLTHYTHCRDEYYIFKLIEHYNTPEKILETLALAEEHGINAMNVYTVDFTLDLMKKHRDRGGKMQWIICATAAVENGDLDTYKDEVKRLVDHGADAMYVWGGHSDAFIAEGKPDLIGECYQILKSHGIPAGVGAHDLRSIQWAEQDKVEADFYVKTHHHHDYASAPKKLDESAPPETEVPGYWDKNPQATADYMSDIEKPWIAFKTMASGTIAPDSGLKFAFENGADFAFVGMFDYEIEPDVKIASELFSGDLARQRPWRG